uniref:DUF4139 domain-containing protein n=1 Tax=Actinacidiphila yeochonensis TaxID=89050 RepID=UPI00056BC30A|nr:DUF4139 domain-containing protein [Actinacidiphila yeochonensis]
MDPAGPPEPAGPVPLPLPVTAVTCLEDRAQVERTAVVELSVGVQRLRLGPVTPLAVDRSLRAEAVLTGPGPAGEVGAAAQAGAHVAGAQVADVRVVDARVVRAYAPVPPGEPGRDASVPRREVHALEREQREARQQRQRLESALAVVEQARTDLYRDIRQGAGAGDADPERWADRLERVGEAAEARTGELHRLRRRLHDIAEELAEAREALAAAESEPQVLTAHLELVVEAAAAGPAELRVAHLVPCALWRPAYRAALAAGGDEVRLETDAFVWQATGEDWHDVRLALSTARPTLAAGPPGLEDDVLTLRERAPEERRAIEVGLREEEIAALGGDSPEADGAHPPAPPSASELPGVDDGGTVRTLAAPDPVSVPSDGRPHRVVLSAFTAPCRTEHTCAPELSPLVVAAARFTNQAGHVLLAGPVDLVRGSGCTGRGRLAFHGAGEEVRLAFGSEDTFRVVREVEETRDTVGLAGINQRTVVEREVRLFVSRLDAPGDGATRQVVVRERVPVSEVSAVEVRVGHGRGRSDAPGPDGVDADGIATWTLDLAPGERRELSLRCTITASAAVTGL